MSPVFHALVILICSIAVYSNTFSAPFHFDDHEYLIQNTLIRDLRYFTDPSKAGEVLVFDSLVTYTFYSRFIGFLTFALNFQVHGLDTLGYHIVNTAVHVTNALLVYLLAALLLRTPGLSPGMFPDCSGEQHHYRTIIPLFSSLVFAVHPVQTEAVTYISQRFASLATMFYLCAAVCYVKMRLVFGGNAESGHREEGRIDLSAAAWYLTSFFSAVLAMKTKEISFTLPVSIVLAEFFFFRGRLRKRFLLLFPMLLTMLIIPLSMLDVEKPLSELLTDIGKTARANTAISRADYFFTQFRVILTYLRLFLFPANQNFDYDYPLYHSLFHASVFLSVVFVSSVLCSAAYLFSRSNVRSHAEPYATVPGRIISFGIFWFFITIAVESSVIPTNDLIFEHRLYLPSVGLSMSAAASLSWLWDNLITKAPRLQKLFLSFLFGIIVLLSAGAYQRNEVWKDGIGIWEDVIRKSPGKARGFNELGRAYYSREKFDKAIKAYEEALRRDPEFAWAHNNLGLAYYKMGRPDEALQEIKTAFHLGLNNPEICNNLGALYFKKGLVDEAIEYFQFSVMLDPGNASAHNNLGVAYEAKGWGAKASEQFDKAHLLNPDKY